MAIIVGSETQRFKPSRFDVLPSTLLTFLLDSSDVSWNSENKEKIAYLLKVFFCDLSEKSCVLHFPIL